jgi:hypothetical protein
LDCKQQSATFEPNAEQEFNKDLQNYALIDMSTLITAASFGGSTLSD